MSRISLPISLLKTNDVSSLKEHKAREKTREKAGDALNAVLNMQDVFAAWHSNVLAKDDDSYDLAAHKKGLVVLDTFQFSAPRYTTGPIVSAEVQAGRGGQVESSRLDIQSFPQIGPHREVRTQLSYKRTATREVYTQEVLGKQVKLVLDHSKGILTYDDPFLKASRKG